MKKVEDMTILEMLEFAEKAEIVIPQNLKKRGDILEFLKNSGKVKTESAGPQKSAVPTPKQIQEDRDKKAAKIPLSEQDKARLAGLEKLARSGKSPDIDQMKELRILRLRKTITPLSVIEQRELEELRLKAEGAPVDGSNKSGLPDDERLEELRKRSEIE